MQHLWEMSYISLGVLLFSCLDTCDTCGILRYFVKKCKKNVKMCKKKSVKTIPHNTAPKSAVAVFFGILEKHAVSAVRYLPRFRYLWAGCNIWGTLTPAPHLWWQLWLKTLPLTTSCSATPLLSRAAVPPEIFSSGGVAVALHVVVEREGCDNNILIYEH